MPLSTNNLLTRYAERYEYRRRLQRLCWGWRHRCMRYESADYDEYGRCTYPGSPACPGIKTMETNGLWDVENDMPESEWCSRCRRTKRLKAALQKARAAEYSARRSLLRQGQKLIATGPRG